VSGQGSGVDLNADVGESFGRWVLGDDATLLEIVTSANVACGFHAGDPTTMRRTCELAVARGVRIGAQVGYRDLAGFGRRFVDAEPEELADDVTAQIGVLDAFARGAGARVRYVKPHGALYNAIVHHTGQAAAVVDAVRRYDPTLPVVGLPGSQVLVQARQAGLSVVREAFADRAYNPGGTLVARGEPGAVLHDPDVIAERVVRMARCGEVQAVDGSIVALQPDSICLHGDTPGAVVIARRVRAALEGAGVAVRALT
jgi:UPF0271 protein